MRHQQYLQDSNQNAQNESAQKILKAATDLFLDKGYKSITTRNIADAAGVNLGLIPYYYSTKANLAKQVCIEMQEGLNDTFLKDMQVLPAAERMFVASVLSWRKIDENPGTSRFFYEFIESTDSLDYTPTFIADSWQTIKHYGLNISEFENSLYLSIMRATERPLVLKRYHKEINLSHEDIVEVLTSHYFFDIGLPDKEIARIIAFSRSYCGNTESFFK